MTWYLKFETGDVVDMAAETRKEAIAEAKEKAYEDDQDQHCAVFCEWSIMEAISEPECDHDDWEYMTIIVQPPEPKCSDGEHDWQSPFKIVGGIKDNPGVFGNGGGVTITECCMKCGCRRVTNTWATNPLDGTQGHETIEYTEDDYSDRLLEIAMESGKSIGKAMARDVLADGLPKEWAGIEGQDGDQLTALGFSPGNDFWGAAVDAAQSEYEDALSEAETSHEV